MEEIILRLLEWDWSWISFFKAILLTYIVIEFPVFKVIKEFLLKRVKFKYLSYFILKFFTCYKCSGLYIGLLVSGNVWIALGVSLALLIYDKNLNILRL